MLGSGAQGRDAASIVEMLAGPLADRYIYECLVRPLSKIANCGQTLEQVSLSIKDPSTCLRILFAQYAYSRRGKERFDLFASTVEALGDVAVDGSLEAFLQLSDGVSLWPAFENAMTRRGRPALEQVNRGIVQGLAELAQEAYRESERASIAGWIGQNIAETGKLESCFLRIVDIRGVGPKVCSLFLRDVVFMLDLEARLHPAERIFVQPIDKWLRQVAPYVISDLPEGEAPDWILAGKLAKTARQAGVSGIRFNMGASYFGGRVVGTNSDIGKELEEFLLT